MSEPSKYELAAWGQVQKFKLRPMSAVGQKAINSAQSIFSDFVESHPNAKKVWSKGGQFIAKSNDLAGKAVSKVIPKDLSDWSGEALDSIKTSLAKISRAGLSPKRVVALHRKRGREVESLLDLRTLDLQQVEHIGLKSAAWYYPAIAAASGAGASFIITGSELAVVASGGASTAPSGGVVAATIAGDLAVLNALSSRAIGHFALMYGYDPEEPMEKVFMMSIVNAGTAFSMGAKTLAMKDISNLTQALVRGKTWKELSKTVIGKAADQFNQHFTNRIVKSSLGKAVPAIGIIIGGAFNWATLERLTDVAQIVYRRRFLLEKYPQLAESGEPFNIFEDSGIAGEEEDEAFSIVDELKEAGGPTLS
jgi:hypothetical protein